MRIPTIAFAFVAAICQAGGCDRPQSPPSNSATQVYSGPAFAIESSSFTNPLNDSRGFVIKTTVPMGGHDLRIDRTEADGFSWDVYATLTQPGVDEMVTQVITTLEQPVDTGGVRVTALRLFVNLTRRGDKDKPADYRLAVRWPTPP